MVWSWNLFSMVMLMDLKHNYWQYSNCLPKFKGNCKLIIQFLSSQLWADVCMNFFMIITSLMAVILLIDWLPWSVIHLGDSLICIHKVPWKRTVNHKIFLSHQQECFWIYPFDIWRAFVTGSFENETVL